MRINDLKVTNFMRVGSFAEHIEPMTFFAATNNSGKSSLRDAIEFALTGAPGRAETKKNLPLLLQRGAATGKSAVTLDGVVIERDVATGKALGAEPRLPAALPFVLQSQSFAALTAVERRQTLFSLMKLSSDADAIVERLKARGIDEALVDRIKHLLAAGFAPALTEAEKFRLKQKGAWHEVTGETWGVKKAETWVSEAPAFNQSALDEAISDTAGWEAEVARLNRVIGGAREAKKAMDELPALRETAKGYAPAADELNKWQKRRKEIKDELATLVIPTGEEAPKQAAIPMVGAAEKPEAMLVTASDLLKSATCYMRAEFKAVPEWVVATEEFLTAYAARFAPQQPAAPAKAPEAPKVDQAALKAEQERVAAKMRELADAIDGCDEKIAAQQAKVDEANRAAVLKDELEKKATAGELPDLAKLTAELQEASNDLSLCKADVETLSAAKRAADAAKATTERATAIHSEVMRWDALVSALSPDGLPAEILRDALGPFEKLLTQFAEETGWAPVEVAPDMSIRCDGFTYSMLGESMQWRVDVMLSVAIAILSEIKLILIDRFDVLDGGARAECLNWIYQMTQDKVLDSALLFGTLKEKPALPEGAVSYWIGEKA